MDALRAFAARRGVNLDLALERLGFVREANVAFAAAEQGLEDGPEMISDLGEGLEKQRLRRLVDFAGRLLQRVARGDELVTQGLEELEPLGLFRVLFDGERVHRSDGVDRAAQPVILLAEPLEIAGDLWSFGEQRRERLAPFRFHPLDEPAFAAFDLRALELEPVLFLAQGAERLARLIERPFRLAEVCLRHADLRLRVSGGRFELGQRETAFLQRIRPLCALRREGGRLVLATDNLLGARSGLFA